MNRDILTTVRSGEVDAFDQKYDTLRMLEEEIASCCGCTISDGAEDTRALHTHDHSYEFFYVMSGRAVHNVNGLSQTVSKGMLVLIRPWDIHEYFPIQNYGFSLVSMGFQDYEFEGLQCWTELDLYALAHGPLPPAVMLSGTEKTYVESWINLLYKSACDEERRQIFHVLFPLLCYIIKNRSTVDPLVVPPWLTKVVRQMSLKENFIPGLSALYAMTDYSVEYVTRCFRKYLRTTPTELINTNRINYAAELLKQGHVSITDVCYEVGYNNLSYFYELFRKYMGCTPGVYVKTQLKPPVSETSDGRKI